MTNKTDRKYIEWLLSTYSEDYLQTLKTTHKITHTKYIVESPNCKSSFKSLGLALAYATRLYRKTRICARIITPEGETFNFKPKAYYGDPIIFKPKETQTARLGFDYKERLRQARLGHENERKRKKRGLKP